MSEDDDDDDADNHLTRAQQAGYTSLTIRTLEPDHRSNDSGYAKPDIGPDHKKGVFSSDDSYFMGLG